MGRTNVALPACLPVRQPARLPVAWSDRPFASLARPALRASPARPPPAPCPPAAACFSSSAWCRNCSSLLGSGQGGFGDSAFGTSESAGFDSQFAQQFPDSTFDSEPGYELSDEQLPSWMTADEPAVQPTPAAPPSFIPSRPAATAPAFRPQSQAPTARSNAGVSSVAPPFVPAAQRPTPGMQAGGAGQQRQGRHAGADGKWQQQQQQQQQHNWQNNNAARTMNLNPRQQQFLMKQQQQQQQQQKQQQKQQQQQQQRKGTPLGDSEFEFQDVKRGARDKSKAVVKHKDPKLAPEIVEKKTKARLQEMEKKKEEERKLAKERIAAAREEVNEPIFVNDKNAQRERERERERERQRELERRNAEARARAASQAKKEKARGRAKEDKRDAGDQMGSESPDDSSKASRKDQKKRDDADISDSVASSEDDSAHRRDRKERGKKDSTKRGDRGRKNEADKIGRKQRKPDSSAANITPTAKSAPEVKSNINVSPTGNKAAAHREENRLPPATSFISTVMQWLGLTAWWVSGIVVHVATIFFRLIMSLQKSALDGLTADHHVAFCFTFLYSFPFLVSYLAPWAPPWYGITAY